MGRRLTEEESPFIKYDDYFLCMGAPTTDIRSEMGNKRIGKRQDLDERGGGCMCVLLVGSYVSNCHMRTYVTEGASALGTTVNGALHTELRTSFRQVYDIHIPVERLRLTCFVLSKQAAFEAERRVNVFRQRRDSYSTKMHACSGAKSMTVECGGCREDSFTESWLTTVKKKTKFVKTTVFTGKRQTPMIGAGACMLVVRYTAHNKKESVPLAQCVERGHTFSPAQRFKVRIDTNNKGQNVKKTS